MDDDALPAQGGIVRERESIFARQNPRKMTDELALEINHAGAQGWIDCSKIDQFLTDQVRFVVATDGTDAAMLGFEYVVQALMQQDRQSFVCVAHHYDDTKVMPTPAWRREALKQAVEAALTSSLVTRRYRLNFVKRVPGEPVGRQLVRDIEENQADFITMGIMGRKGRKVRRLMASNVMEVVNYGKCSCIIMNNFADRPLPIKRPTRFLVSISLSVAATKAFIDALRLSKPGDEIQVVYVKSHLEESESNYTGSVREKYRAFMQGVQGVNEDEGCAELVRYSDRVVLFHIVEKDSAETTGEALVRHAEEADVDFILMGIDTTRAERGKEQIGRVNMTVCTETSRHFVISAYTPSFRPGAAKGSRPNSRAAAGPRGSIPRPSV